MQDKFDNIEHSFIVSYKLPCTPSNNDMSRSINLKKAQRRLHLLHEGRNKLIIEAGGFQCARARRAAEYVEIIKKTAR